MKTLREVSIKEKILSAIGNGEILFIFPPFSRSCKGAPLDPHTLQALAIQQGYKADILYLNILLASLIGVDLYESISNAPRFWMLGERLFARSAYGLPPLGKSPELCTDEAMSISGNKQGYVTTCYDMEEFDLTTYLNIEDTCYSLIETVAPIIGSLHYKLIWCTIGWEQTNCAIAMFNRIKKFCPDTITLIGGMNCEGEMADGIASLSEAIDYVFSGEIELAFNNFLELYSANKLPSQRVISGSPVKDLDILPLPDYENFFAQVELFWGDDVPRKLIISYETSRGCWKGQRQRCAFCGLNSEERIKYRYKTAETAAKELQELTHRHANTVIFMTDHILPSAYYQELLPTLNLPKEASIRYELLANLSLHDLLKLKAARINRIQPGIEALSTNLLQLIHKGITAHQNVLVLRNALSVGIFVHWYLLWGLPGDKAMDYEKTLKLLPLLRHLQPPSTFLHIRFERFSLYVENPEQYRITNLRPWAVYNMVYPDWADVENIAYRFIGEYPCEAHEHPELIREIAKEVELWRKSWRTSNLIMRAFADYYIVHDSRGLGKDTTHILNVSQAKAIMTYGEYTASELQQWAVGEKLALVVDSYYVPLITASPEILVTFEE
jgi:ribosomal peptide maturation radical SAM protein 1